MVVEYKDIPQWYFLRWYMGLMYGGKYQIKETYGKLYCYQLHIERTDGAYLHLFYRNPSEKGSGWYTLRLETRPEYYEQFTDELEEIRRQTSGVYFVSCDIAYDITISLDNVFVGSKDMRRELNLYKGTRYFGEAHQRKQDGYCRVYDKQLELWERHRIQTDGELTRIEIVYKPESRIPLTDIINHPPTQNRQYFASIIEDWTVLPAKQVERVRNWQIGENTYTRYIRETIKQLLADRSIDFDQLASEQWEAMLAKPCAALLGKETVLRDSISMK
ncbi:replication initiation factor family [Paenibacillus curdlanolyticus YK9]|uniref:Replication initiation factor family n=2 Tax=Paenibacillus curdlanolyticus TaxID=59840 RepID=E0I4K3_9BACL|nr:replication initiation factor family [Paenibacillus curdlanolyticus YK9]